MNHTHELVVDEIAKEIVHIHPELPQLHGTDSTDKAFRTTHRMKHGQAACNGSLRNHLGLSRESPAEPCGITRPWYVLETAKLSFGVGA